MSNSTYIYGEWRGKPAREDRQTGVRYYLDAGLWCQLGLGYNTEFKPFPEELPADPWESLHHRAPVGA